MEKIIIEKSKALKGTVTINGAKNSALPILAATLLGTEDIILYDVPPLDDIKVMLEVIKSLGAKVDYLDEMTVLINSKNLSNHITPYELMSKMRASFLVMGPLLARLGKSITALPGGCAIGARPIDLHLKGFKTLGCEIIENINEIGASAEFGLKGNIIYLDFPSVGATQNLMMAASMAEGITLIENAAREPEIVDLANFLNKLGANIKGAGTSNIKIKGVKKLGGTKHSIIPDRIEAATFMIGAAMTKGSVMIENVIPSHLNPVIAKLREAGCTIEERIDGIFVVGPEKLMATNIKTMPYPGFPTDVQSPLMSLMTISEGTSRVVETVFENRFMHVAEFRRMGADIKVENREAIIKGVKKLYGAEIRSTDLRAGVALAIAGLVAEGTTILSEIHHIDRGYYKFEDKLASLGANIKRVSY